MPIVLIKTVSVPVSMSKSSEASKIAERIGYDRMGWSGYIPQRLVPTYEIWKRQAGVANLDKS